MLHVRAETAGLLRHAVAASELRLLRGSEPRVVEITVLKWRLYWCTVGCVREDSMLVHRVLTKEVLHALVEVESRILLLAVVQRLEQFVIGDPRVAHVETTLTEALGHAVVAVGQIGRVDVHGVVARCESALWLCLVVLHELVRVKAELVRLTLNVSLVLRHGPVVLAEAYVKG